jgi:hypothetical protein
VSAADELAYLLPIGTTVWLSPVLLISAIAFATVFGAYVAGPLLHMLESEVDGVQWTDPFPKLGESQ